VGIEEQKQIFQKLYNVPRETIRQLSVYYDLLTHAQKTTNLIGSGSVKNIWLRHFADSAKLAEIMISHYKNMDRPLTFCDVGSGAGFPGIVCFLVLSAKGYPVSLNLVESNKKKCKFLDKVKKELGLSFNVINKRVEKLDGKYDFVLARAVAPLRILLELTFGLFKKETILLFPKGKNFLLEIKESKKIWNFSCNIVKNKVLLDNTGGVTLEISNLRKLK